MTAFARREAQTPQGDLTWEIRSVNHRYLETSLRLDECFRPLEIQIKKLFADKLGRGKIDASLRFKPTDQQRTELNINHDLAKSLITQCEQLAALTKDPAPIDMLKLLQWPDILQASERDQKSLNQSAMASLEHAVDELITMRETEGVALQTMIAQRCDEINTIAIDVRAHMPEIIEQQRQRLLDRVVEMNIKLDPERLEQEIVILAQKSDVAEELDRLQSHIVEVQNILKTDKPTGRRLDFLMQELNREANTLGSKSINTDTTRHSVNLKVLIEQMREQIQNIE